MCCTPPIPVDMLTRYCIILTIPIYMTARQACCFTIPTFRHDSTIVICTQPWVTRVVGRWPQHLQVCYNVVGIPSCGRQYHGYSVNSFITSSGASPFSFGDNPSVRHCLSVMRPEKLQVEGLNAKAVSTTTSDIA